MPAPIIQSVGATSGPGTAGQGRNDLVPGEQIDLSDSEAGNVGSAYLWEFEDVPIGTTPALVNPTTATPHFIVDADPLKAGSYRVKATVDGTVSSAEVLAVPLSVLGSRIPSFREQLEDDSGGNTKGWHKALSGFMRDVNAALADAGPGAAGDALHLLIWGGGRESHNSDTPLVVGAFAFDPNAYDLTNTTVAFQFVIIAACGTTPLTAHAHLFNLTDGEIVASSVLNIVNSTTPTKYTSNLIVGASVGQIKNSAEKIYECRIFLNVAPSNPDTDTVELFKAEVHANFTVG